MTSPTQESLNTQYAENMAAMEEWLALSALPLDQQVAEMDRRRRERLMKAPYRVVRFDKKIQSSWLFGDTYMKFLYLVGPNGEHLQTYIYPNTSSIKSYPENEYDVILCAGEEDEMRAEFLLFSGRHAEARELKEKARLRKAQEAIGDGPQDWGAML